MDSPVKTTGPAATTPGLGDDPEPQKKRSRARRGDGDRLRDEILQAAEDLLIATDDQSALSIRAIAASVGVTPPSIYLHFADRNELLFAVCERRWAELERAIETAAAGVRDPIERLKKRGEAYLRFGLVHPEHYRILMMSRPDRTPARFVDERLAGSTGLEVVVADVQAAMDAGLVPEQDVTEVACLLWMSVHGMVSLLISKPEFPFPPVEQLFGHLYTMIQHGLSSRDPLSD